MSYKKIATFFKVIVLVQQNKTYFGKRYHTYLEIFMYVTCYIWQLLEKTLGDPLYICDGQQSLVQTETDACSSLHPYLTIDINAWKNNARTNFSAHSFCYITYFSAHSRQFRLFPWIILLFYLCCCAWKWALLVFCYVCDDWDLFCFDSIQQLEPPSGHGSNACQLNHGPW